MCRIIYRKPLPFWLIHTVNRFLRQIRRQRQETKEPLVVILAVVKLLHELQIEQTILNCERFTVT